MAVAVHLTTLVVQHTAVAALMAAYEEDEVVLHGEGADVVHAVGHLAADGVETLKLCLRRYVLLDIENDAVELVERLGGL